MTDFKTFTEDFNNWRSPVNANPAGPDIISMNNTAAQPTGFKGDKSGGSGSVEVKLPKKLNPRQKLVRLLAHIKEKKTK